MDSSQMTTEELLRVLGSVEEDDEFSETTSLHEDDLESITDSQERINVSPVLPSTSHTGQETPDYNRASTSASSSTTHRDRRRSQTETSFQWTSAQYVAALTSFDEFASGLNFEVTENMTELDTFFKFLDKDFMSFIVQMTNEYHSRFVLNVDLRIHSRLQRWHDVSIPELYIFFAILMLMTRNRHLTIEEHWSTDLLLSSPIFSQRMPRNRFCTILSMLHFSRPSEETNVLSKINTCINHAKEKFKKNITPYKNLCIDESIVPFKGRLSIKQYLPMKRNRFGIKLFVMCDVETGIIIDFIVYCGAATQIIDPCNLGVGGAVVSTLIRDYFGTYRHLYIDNWYTSPALLNYLHENNIYACGTVKKNRIGMPRFNTLKPGEVQAQYSPPMTALKWRDKKDIFLLSTIHSDVMAPSLKEDRATGLPVMKPQAVLDYSKNMGSIDTADMLLSSIQCIRKTVKWYKKLFLHIIDMHVLNSFFSFRQIKNMPNLHFSQFQLSLIRQIIENFHSFNTLPSSISSSHNNPLRILPKNYNDHMPTLMGKYQRCRQCAIKKERKETRYTCKICKVYLCAAPCFKKYHS